MMPSLFLAHGSPMLAIEETPYTQFLSDLGEQIRPKAIVIFTAHWESGILTISSSDNEYDTIYDFGGFPPALYAMKYPAKGSSAVASKLAERLTNCGIPVQKDMTRGLDHGAWTLLSRIYPNADIPVVQVSIHPYLSPEEQYKIGEAIRDLRKEDILIIGSGVTVHNLRMLEWDKITPEKWAVEFDDWLIDKIQKKDLQSLFQYTDLAQNSRLAVPRPEHFVPLFIAMGSGDVSQDAKIIYRTYDLGTLSYLCFQF